MGEDVVDVTYRKGALTLFIIVHSMILRGVESYAPPTGYVIFVPGQYEQERERVLYYVFVSMPCLIVKYVTLSYR